jgi:phage-related protein
MDSVAKKLDPEVREQVQPLLEAILQAQPTIKIKSYEQTTISITMPRMRYDRMGRPQVGEVLEINISKK